MFQRSNSALMISKSDVKSTYKGMNNKSIDNIRPKKNDPFRQKKWAIIKMARKILQGNKIKRYFNKNIYAGFTWLIATILISGGNYRRTT